MTKATPSHLKHIILYSGGLSSFLAAKRVLKKQKKEDVLLVFTDTKTEDPDLYRFLDESSDYLGCELLTLEDGRDIWQVFSDVKYMGNNRIDPCSRILKRDLFRKWLKKKYSPKECRLYYGISWDEDHRITNIKKRWIPYKVCAPMCEAPYLTPKQMQDELKKTGIKLPRLYDMGFPHNNCGGFCVKTGQAQFALLLKQMPERYKEHEEKQEKLFKKIGSRGFIRRTVKGKLHYLSLKQFRELIERGEIDVDKYDFGGCACFA